MRELIDNEIDALIESLNEKREALYTHADKINRTVSQNKWFKKGEIVYGFCPMASPGRVKVVTGVIKEEGKICLWNNNFKPTCEQKDIKILVLGVDVKELSGLTFNHRQWAIDRAQVGQTINVWSYNPRGRVHPWKKQDWYDANFKKEEG